MTSFVPNAFTVLVSDCVVVSVTLPSDGVADFGRGGAAGSGRRAGGGHPVVRLMVVEGWCRIAWSFGYTSWSRYD
jgi:hypothetical protein